MGCRKPHQPKQLLGGRGSKANPEYQVYRRQRRRRWLDYYKRRKGCEICGYNQYGVALDFDHLDRNKKEFNLSSRSLNLSLKRIFKEIRKCRILCANCHRVHSFMSKHFNNPTGRGGTCGV